MNLLLSRCCSFCSFSLYVLLTLDVYSECRRFWCDVATRRITHETRRKSVDFVLLECHQSEYGCRAVESTGLTIPSSRMAGTAAVKVVMRVRGSYLWCQNRSAKHVFPAPGSPISSTCWAQTIRQGESRASKSER